jgi:hypothetical protein
MSPSAADCSSSTVPNDQLVSAPEQRALIDDRKEDWRSVTLSAMEVGGGNAL